MGTRREPVVEVLHGVEVVDPYRWLEDGDADEVRAWTAEQNAQTDAWLAAVPARAAIHRRLQQLLGIGVLGTPTPARGRYLYQRREGSTNQPVLYVRDGLEGTDRVAIDPNALSREGTTALDWYHVSPDGRRLAYGLSADGSEQSVLQVLDLDTLAPLADRIPHTRSCDLAWLPDGTGFYYTRYPAPGSVPAGEEQYHRAIWFHRLGDDPAVDRLVFTPAEKEHWPGVALSDDGRWLVIGVARTFDETDLYLQDLAPGGQLVPVAIGQAATFDCQVAHGVMYIRTNRDAPTFRLYAADPTSADARLARARPCTTRCGALERGRDCDPPCAGLSRACNRASSPRRTRWWQRARGGPADAWKPLRPGDGARRHRSAVRVLVVHRAAKRVPP